jgi:hypothetical protein
MLMPEDIKLEFDIVAFELEVAEITEKNIPFCEAIVMWCEQRNIELELLSSIIKKNAPLKARVEEDARSRNLLKR